MLYALSLRRSLQACTPDTTDEAPRLIIRSSNQTSLEKLTIEKLIPELAASLGVSPRFAQILIGRGIASVEHAKRFLSPTLREDLPDPCGIKNIISGARLLLDSIKKGSRIVVYSDFDVDGLSGASQLVLFLHALGGNVGHFVPNRFREGYGVSKSALEKLIKAGTEVLVTVDCGITNYQEIHFAKQAGLKTVIIDHHEVGQLPPADVIIDPLQEGCEFKDYKLAAAGLVWMLLVVLRKEAVTVLREEIENGRCNVPNPKDFLDLAALGTICDMVPLQNLNRLIAQRGLEALEVTTRPGLVALKEIAGLSTNKKLNAGHVGFAFGPRINAAGRLGDAGEVFELLVTKDTKRAKSLAERINRLNTERRAIEEKVHLSCIEILRENLQWVERGGLAIFGEDFHLGVIGIVAQRLSEHFYKPTAIMAFGEEVRGGELCQVIKGSVRGVPGFHVADALTELSPLLLKHGGHAQAGGFTLPVENRLEFEKQFVLVAEKCLVEDLKFRELTVDMEIELSEIDYQMVEELSRLAPFGIGNPTPVFVSYGVLIDGVNTMGNGHLRLRLTDGKHYVQAVAWNFHGHPLLTKGAQLDIAYQTTINSYQGISSVQLQLKQVWKTTKG